MASPPLFDGLQLYYRSDVGLWKDTAGTLVASADNDVVLRWDDLSGNNNHAFYDNAHSPYNCAGAVLKTAQINGKGCLRFDGTTTGFKLTNTLTLTDRTQYAVVRSSSAGTSTILAGNLRGLQWRLDSLKPRLVCGTRADIGFASTAIASNTWTQIGVTWDFSSGSFRLSGSDDGTVSLSNSTYGATRYIGVNLVDNGGPQGEWFSGDIAAILAFNGIHTTAQKQQVEAWITAEFGV